MLDKPTIERIASQYYIVADDAKLFCEHFRHPIVTRGYLELEELIQIVRWKAVRQEPNARRNNPGLVRLVTRHAFAASDPRLAVWSLCYLRGVWVRMATAILTVFDPDNYTVMDVRAWDSLKMIGLEKLGLSGFSAPEEQPLNSCETYGAYLKTCKDLSTDFGVSLRDLDRCLWVLNGRPPAELPDWHA